MSNFGLLFSRYLKVSWMKLLNWKIYQFVSHSVSPLINTCMKYVMLINLAQSSSGMHYFHVNLRKCILIS